MKIAVFSDVHGNLKALKAVLEQIKENNVDLTVFLGDIFQKNNIVTKIINNNSKRYTILFLFFVDRRLTFSEKDV